MDLALVPDFTIGEPTAETLTKLEEEILQHIYNGSSHMRAAYVLLAVIRHYRLFIFAVDDDGNPITRWEDYVAYATQKFNVSRSWIYNRVRVFRLGLAAGFTEELIDIDPLTLSLVRNLIKSNRDGTLAILNQEPLGITAGDNDITKREKAKQFVKELDALTPDQRVKRVKGDIEHRIKYYFTIDDTADTNLLWWTSEGGEVGDLSNICGDALEELRKRIRDSGRLLEEN
jgi:hypothetical protein